MASALTFGVSRVHGAGGAALLESAGRFAAELTRRLGRQVDLSVALDYDHQLSAVLAGGLDLAWLPPLLHARAAAEGASLLAVPERSGFITCRSAVLVRRAPATLVDLASLRGVRAAWVSRLSATGHVFPRIDLLAHGATFSDEAFHETPARAMAQVAEGNADLCAVFVGSAATDEQLAAAEVRRLYPEMAERLAVLHVTDLIPPDGLALAAGADADEAELRDALFAFHQTLPGARVLKDLMAADKLVAVADPLKHMLRSWTLLSIARAEAPFTS